MALWGDEAMAPAQTTTQTRMRKMRKMRKVQRWGAAIEGEWAEMRMRICP